MKRKQFSALLLSAVLILALCACGTSSSSSQPTPASVPTPANPSAPVETVPTGSDLDSVPSDPAALLVGEWEHEDGDYAYEFKADGNGTYKYGETVMKFTFETDGSELSLSYEGVETPTILEYSLDGDALNVKDSFDNDTIYVKK